MNTRKLFWVVAIATMAAIALGSANSNYLRPLIYQFAMPIDYFEPEHAKPDQFVKITDRVYAFRHGFNRSLIVDTGEKIAVFDTFNEGHARALQKELFAEFADKPVGWCSTPTTTSTTSAVRASCHRKKSSHIPT